MDDLRKRRREVSEQQVLGEEELFVELEEEEIKKELDGANKLLT